MDLRNSSGIGLRSFYFTTVWKFLSKIFTRNGKCIMWGSIQVHPNQVSKKSFYTFEDIDLCESHANLHKKPRKTLGADSIIRLEISIYCLPSSLTDFRCTLHRVHLQK